MDNMPWMIQLQVLSDIGNFLSEPIMSDPNYWLNASNPVEINSVAAIDSDTFVIGGSVHSSEVSQ